MNQEDLTGSSSNWRQTYVGAIHWGGWHDNWSSWKANFWKRNLVNFFFWALSTAAFTTLKISIVGLWSRYGYQNYYFRRWSGGRWQHLKVTYYWYQSKALYEITIFWFITWRQTAYEYPYMYDVRRYFY